ncbi:transposase family protein [Microcoleus sp.]|uniref:transposase family protein n=1 Tax=Microcoleus sp. TaxID=44472 RepID=UPI003593CCAF
MSHGIPSHDTFGRVFSKIDPEKMERHYYCDIVIDLKRRSPQLSNCYRFLCLY